MQIPVAALAKAVRLLGLRVRISPEHECLSLASVVCYQVEVSAKGPSLVQRSSTECDVGTSLTRRRPTWAAKHEKKNTSVTEQPY